MQQELFTRCNQRNHRTPIQSKYRTTCSHPLCSTSRPFQRRPHYRPSSDIHTSPSNKPTQNTSSPSHRSTTTPQQHTYPKNYFSSPMSSTISSKSITDPIPLFAASSKRNYQDMSQRSPVPSKISTNSLHSITSSTQASVPRKNCQMIPSEKKARKALIKEIIDVDCLSELPHLKKMCLKYLLNSELKYIHPQNKLWHHHHLKKTQREEINGTLKNLLLLLKRKYLP